MEDPNPMAEGFGLDAAKLWAGKDFESAYLYPAESYRVRLIRCARLAIAERERADTLAAERNRALEEAAQQAATVEELRRTYDGEPARPGYWWCAECGREVSEGDVDLVTDQHDGCGGDCTEPNDPAPIGSVWEYTEYYKRTSDGYRYFDLATGRLGGPLSEACDPPNEPQFRRVEADEPATAAAEPDEQRLLAVSRVYRRALFAIHEVRALLLARYPGSRGNIADILARLELFAESVATDLPDLLARSERQNVEMVIEGRDHQSEAERLQIALMIEDWLGGEAGAALAALIRGCFHWSPEFDVEDL